MNGIRIGSNDTTRSGLGPRIGGEERSMARVFAERTHSGTARHRQARAHAANGRSGRKGPGGAPGRR